MVMSARLSSGTALEAVSRVPSREREILARWTRLP